MPDEEAAHSLGKDRLPNASFFDGLRPRLGKFPARIKGEDVSTAREAQLLANI